MGPLTIARFSGVDVRFWADLFLWGRFGNSSRNVFLAGEVLIGSDWAQSIIMCSFLVLELGFGCSFPIGVGLDSRTCLFGNI